MILSVIGGGNISKLSSVFGVSEDLQAGFSFDIEHIVSYACSLSELEGLL